ncbi:hypothetical protein ACE1SV_61700 [Streptomyces sennicomposti]
MTPEFSPSRWAQSGQDRLEPILRDHARQYGADLRFGSELVAFRQDGAGVTATVRGHGGGPYAVRADHLLAADGAHSAIRAALGIGCAGTGALFHNINVLFTTNPTVAHAVADRRFTVCYLEGPRAQGRCCR